jgi:hypothetical protein
MFMFGAMFQFGAMFMSGAMFWFVAGRTGQQFHKGRFQTGRLLRLPVCDPVERVGSLRSFGIAAM